MTIAVFGGKGRVGSRICALAAKKGYAVIPIESADDTDEALHADVAVDFSAPRALDEVIQFCESQKIPLVCGTTGYTKHEFEKLTEFGKKYPLVYKSNFAKGMSCFRESVRFLARLVPDWDKEIVEIHRREKSDVPSGTALSLAGDISEDGECFVNAGRLTKRDNDCAVHSLRCGTVFGTHTVVFAGNGETITVTHNAENVDVFAEGAISAAEELVLKKNCD